MTPREYNLLRLAYIVRGIIVVTVGGLIGMTIWYLTEALTGEDTDDSLTTILGGLTVGLTTVFGILANAIARDLTEFIKDARGTPRQEDG